MTESLSTLSFDSFWSWLLQHPNCILRAGTPDAVLFDDEDLHWHFAVDGTLFYVQVIRGKRLLGEIVVDSERVAYVQALGEEREGEYGFELISESATERVAACFFVLSHGFDDRDVPGHERAVH